MLLVLSAPPASAAGGSETPPAWKLSYVREGEAHGCPDEATLRARVAGLLGLDRFGDGARRELRVVMDAEPAGLHARLSLVEADGWVAGERLLRTRGADCAELFEAVALAVAIAIDPRRGLAPATPAPAPAAATNAAEATGPAPADGPGEGEPEAARPPTPGPAGVTRPAVPPAGAAGIAAARMEKEERGRSSLHVLAGLGGLVALGAAPAVDTGGVVRGVLRWPTLSLAAEGRWDRGASAALTGGGEVSAALRSAALVLCLHRRAWAGCALLAGGALRGQGAGLRQARTVHARYAAAGLRLQAEAPIGRWLAAQAWSELTVPFGRTTFWVDAEPVWRSPRLSGALGLGLTARLWDLAIPLP